MTTAAKAKQSDGLTVRQRIRAIKQQRMRLEADDNPVVNGPKHLHFAPTLKQWDAWKALRLPKAESDWMSVQRELYPINVLFGGSKGPGKSIFCCIWAYTYAHEVIRHFNLKPAKEVPHIGWMGRKRATDFVATTLQTWQTTIPKSCYILKPATGKHPQHILIDSRVAIDYGGLDNRNDIERFNSAEYGFICPDQAEETNEDDVGVLLASRRMKLLNEATGKMEMLPYRGLFTANPRVCWLIPRFIQNPDDYHVFVPAIYKDNPYLPPGYVNTLEEAFSHRPDLLRAYRDGDWTNLSGVDQIVLQEWISAAKMRRCEQPYYKRWVSVDPARFGDDNAVILGGENMRIVRAKWLPSCGEPAVIQAAAEMSVEMGRVPIVVEEVGVCGIGDHLEDQGFEVIHYCPAGKMEKGPMELQYYNQRAAMWSRVGRYFQSGIFDTDLCATVTLFPESDDRAVQLATKKVCEQLTWPRYDFRGQKVLVQPKEEIKKEHHGVSPDFADAYVNGVGHLHILPSGDPLAIESNVENHRRLIRKYRRPA